MWSFSPSCANSRNVVLDKQIIAQIFMSVTVTTIIFISADICDNLFYQLFRLKEIDMIYMEA